MSITIDLPPAIVQEILDYEKETGNSLRRGTRLFGECGNDQSLPKIGWKMALRPPIAEGHAGFAPEDAR